MQTKRRMRVHRKRGLHERLEKYAEKPHLPRTEGSARAGGLGRAQNVFGPLLRFPQRAFGAMHVCVTLAAVSRGTARAAELVHQNAHSYSQGALNELSPEPRS